MTTHSTDTKAAMLSSVHTAWGRAAHLARFADQPNSGQARKYLSQYKPYAKNFDGNPTMKSRNVRYVVEQFKAWLRNAKTTKTPRAGIKTHLKPSEIGLKAPVDTFPQRVDTFGGHSTPSQIPATAAVDLRTLMKTHNLTFEDLKYVSGALEKILNMFQTS